MDFVFFMSMSTRRLTGSGSGFKASQKTGPQLKESSVRLIGYILFVGVFLGCTSTGRVGLCFL